MNIAQHLATTLKSLRQQRGWSLSRLAEETGVSKAMLGQIERNESSPTVATLWKIATGLNVAFSTFIVADETAAPAAFDPQQQAMVVTPIFPTSAKNEPVWQSRRGFGGISDAHTASNEGVSPGGVLQTYS